MPDQNSTAARVALVTGAARRIGASIATALHQRGLRVMVHYRNSAQAANTLVDAMNTLRPNSAWAIAADLCDVEQARALVARTLALLIILLVMPTVTAMRTAMKSRPSGHSLMPCSNGSMISVTPEGATAELRDLFALQYSRKV